MSTIYSFKEGQRPDIGQFFYIFYKHNESDTTYDSHLAYLNPENKIIGLETLDHIELEYWGYSTDVNHLVDNVDDYIEITLFESSKSSDDEYEDENLGVFKEMPTEEQFSKFLKNNLNAELLSFTSLNPKLTVLDILGEKAFAVDIYSNFTIRIDDTVYNGLIKPYEVMDWE